MRSVQRAARSSPQSFPRAYSALSNRPKLEAHAKGMKDARLVEFRRRALRDPKLSGNAARLIALIVEWLYLEPIGAEDEFPMPWSRVARWTGAEKPDTVRAWFDELDGKYIKRGALKNCPPTRHFFLCLNYPENGVIDYPAKGAIKHPAKGAINYPEKGVNHISNPFRKEPGAQRESISSLRSTKEGEGENSSLRSKEAVEKVGSLRSKEGAADAATLSTLFAAMKNATGVTTAQGKGKGASSVRRPSAAGTIHPKGPTKPQKP